MAILLSGVLNLKEALYSIVYETQAGFRSIPKIFQLCNCKLLNHYIEIMMGLTNLFVKDIFVKFPINAAFLLDCHIYAIRLSGR